MGGHIRRRTCRPRLPLPLGRGMGVVPSDRPKRSRRRTIAAPWRSGRYRPSLADVGQGRRIGRVVPVFDAYRKADITVESGRDRRRSLRRPYRAAAKAIAASTTGTFQYEKGGIRHVYDSNNFFRSDAIGYLTRIRRRGRSPNRRTIPGPTNRARRVQARNLPTAARMLVGGAGTRGLLCP